MIKRLINSGISQINIDALVEVIRKPPLLEIVKIPFT